ncbi:MAG: HAD family phosphatase [Bdellovibrionales bacterium]|nr:HAD family phosphatase [Bdellovibrionales bacterium]
MGAPPPPRPGDAVLFDLDGTLIDSEPVAFRAVLECCGEWGVPVAQADAAQVAGKKWEVAVELLFTRYKIPVGKEEFTRTVVDRYKKKLVKEMKIIPGAPEMVRRMAKQGPIALVSGSHREEIFWALDRLKVRDLFRFVLGAEDYPLSKPAPDGFMKAIAALGVPPGETLIFEDSEAGVASGLAAGAKVVAVTHANHFGHDLSRAHAQIPDFHGADEAWLAALAKKLIR